MKQYLDALQYVLDNGEVCSDRTGVGTRSVFGYQMKYDLREGFPAVTTKRLAWKAVVGELLWFLEGSTDERRLAEITYEKHRVDLVGKQTIWTANAYNQGRALGHYHDEYTKELGPVYGSQWRNFNGQGYDQIAEVITQIRTNPDSRRIILSAWNPLQTAEMALPPCHTQPTKQQSCARPLIFGEQQIQEQRKHTQKRQCDEVGDAQHSCPH